MKQQLTAAATLILIVTIAGCASTGQVAGETAVGEPEPAPAAVPQPPLSPTTTVQPVSVNECSTNSDCPSGQSCLDSTCVKIQFVK